MQPSWILGSSGLQARPSPAFPATSPALPLPFCPPEVFNALERAEGAVYLFRESQMNFKQKNSPILVSWASLS